MLMPSIFGEDMFDDFMRDFPFFDDRELRKADRKLYGHHAKNLMKTDIKETDQGYELEMDLPGFTKDEVSVSPWKKVLLTVSQLRKVWIRTSRRRRPANTSVVSVMQVPANVPSMLAKELLRPTSRGEFKHGILKLFIPKKKQNRQ